MTRRILAIGASALLLASCGGGKDAGESKDAAETGPQGEVLGGTITDSMLPVVMTQSQSPKRGGEDDGDKDDADKADGADQADGADGAEADDAG